MSIRLFGLQITGPSVVNPVRSERQPHVAPLVSRRRPSSARRRRRRPPRASTTSLVPFSWERHPGVPKNSFRGGRDSPTGNPLPLPPPLLRPAAPRRRRRRQPAKAGAPAASSSSDARDDDPFFAAFAECTRDDDDDYAAADDADADDDDTKNKLWPVPAKPAGVSSGRAERRWWIAGGGGGLVAFLDMHGCKSAMDVVADGAFHPRRLVAAADPRPPVVRGTAR
ncbi:unnamed protein product [Miscanthus lutarioriparius]|uniref:Uncharacterized protein n=1 Tax=Miscanthus lutarioriparius TaxID=422564 RepID=A0A811REF5_9POAL|nr:unnamed protein product [Miscanthus lutarioriparius]